MRKSAKLLLLLAVAVTAPANTARPMDQDNPTCPAQHSWSKNTKMEFTPMQQSGSLILLAEGPVDAALPQRLEKALTDHPTVSEIWFRSQGGDARAGNKAGLILRKKGAGIITRIPAGWTCFSACNFVFLGGQLRVVEEGAYFMVHMFTMTGQRDVINSSLAEGVSSTVEMIGNVEQDSAQLATEDNDFMIRMGVSRKLLKDRKSTRLNSSH